MSTLVEEKRSLGPARRDPGPGISEPVYPGGATRCRARRVWGLPCRYVQRRRLIRIFARSYTAVFLQPQRLWLLML